jgi:hypothetical protein
MYRIFVHEILSVGGVFCRLYKGIWEERWIFDYSFRKMAEKVEVKAMGSVSGLRGPRLGKILRVPQDDLAAKDVGNDGGGDSCRRPEE